MPIDIASLSAADKKELYAQLAHEFQAGTDASDLPTDLWDAICHIMRMEGRARMPLKRFVDSFGKAKYIEHAQQLESLITRAVPRFTRKTQVMAVRRIILGCLVEHMESRDIPITPTSILNCFGMLRMSVEKSYPGYIDAQLLHRVAVAFAA